MLVTHLRTYLRNAGYLLFHLKNYLCWCYRCGRLVWHKSSIVLECMLPTAQNVNHYKLLVFFWRTTMKLPNSKMKNNVYALLKFSLILSKPQCLSFREVLHNISHCNQQLQIYCNFFFWRGVSSLTLDELPVKNFRAMGFLCCSKLNIFLIIIAADWFK